MADKLCGNADVGFADPKLEKGITVGFINGKVKTYGTYNWHAQPASKILDVGDIARFSLKKGKCLVEVTASGKMFAKEYDMDPKFATKPYIWLHEVGDCIRFMQ